MEWKYIDFDKNEIGIHHASQSLPGMGTFLKDTKNETSERTVSVSAKAIKILSEYKEWHEGQKEMMGDIWVDSGMVFTQRDGKMMYTNTPTQWFKDFRDRNNLNLSDVNFHGLRHTNAAILIGEGVDIQTVAGRLGHAKPTTTLEKYSHFQKNLIKELLKN